MWQPQLNDRVRLIHDVPELCLHRGDVGVVKSVWFAPESAYEVEFEQAQSDFRVRKVLQAQQVELEPRTTQHQN